MLRAQALRRVDLHAPDREAVAVVVDDVEVGRVLERDAVEREVVGVVGDNEARNLLAAAGARLLGQIPPGVLRAEHLFAAAAVDDAVAHDAGVGRVIDGDERLAAAGAGRMADDAATAGRNGEDGRIARGEERHAQADDERDVGRQFQRAAEEGVVGLVDVEQHGAALCRTGRWPSGCARCRAFARRRARSEWPLASKAARRAVVQSCGKNGSMTVRVSCAARQEERTKCDGREG